MPAFDFGEILTGPGLAALVQVLTIDLVLAGDNAIVVGALAAGLPPRDRRRVILVGIIAALVLRIAFALVATALIEITGLLLAGGLLLLWVAWKFWREIRSGGDEIGEAEAAAESAPGSFLRAAIAVAVADVSMSLDNVLGVVGAAAEHPAVLVIGLVLSVALMGLAANLIARIIGRHRWIAYVGLAVILYVALHMIWRGSAELAPLLGSG
ncbi:YjbE family putative metal transport protein [Sphingomonas oryzagri]|uniref:YjbE family putative metal transport protein n=1 Tax=Sphingomonas oryzagri TaxID=3042314 RepID=A0ABT6N532_9SPHN|nr:YjbE family putative metal transport protein [Sphingomonas oryzagri]MDH7640224.1 YjbE family putative metal transport protein [Sphingomonas oryzagri]